MADTLGLDILSFQDHPYQAKFLDTWTLLSNVAAQTSNVQLAPNVANLPLRPPAVLARSVATLDILSGGRAQLGLGSGAFWDGIAALGGRKLTPGQGVDALTEALDVIRAMWSGERAVTVEGEYYSLTARIPARRRAHDIEIWLGAYKPRMLALTGARADGWIPSMGYADPHELGPHERGDRRGGARGRAPPEPDPPPLQRQRPFGSGSGFLEGGRRLGRAAGPADPGAGHEHVHPGRPGRPDVRLFAEEVAPAVRELVERERGRHAAGRSRRPARRRAAGADGAQPFAVTPTPDDGTRVAPSRSGTSRAGPRGRARARRALHARPAGRRPAPDRRARRPARRAGAPARAGAQLEQGDVDPSAVRSFLNRMTIRQNNWTLGVYCASYCRIVTGHHTLEDRSVFPHLKARAPGLGDVIDRLQEEHEVIADLLERIDAAIVALVSSEGIEDVRARWMP